MTTDTGPIVRPREGDTPRGVNARVIAAVVGLALAVAACSTPGVPGGASASPSTAQASPTATEVTPHADQAPSRPGRSTGPHRLKDCHGECAPR